MLKIFTIHDSKAEAYLQPFFAPTTATAQRSFEAAANDQKSDFHRYAGDYTLFEVGTYDTDTGELIPLPTMLNLGLALTYRTNPEYREAVQELYPRAESS